MLRLKVVDDIKLVGGVKLIAESSSQELMELRAFEDTSDRVAKANRIQWYGQILKRHSDYVLRRALHFEVVGRRKRGRPNMTWRRQVVKQVEEIGLKRKMVLTDPKWRDAVNKLSKIMMWVRPLLVTETKPDLIHWIFLLLQVWRNVF